MKMKYKNTILAQVAVKRCDLVAVSSRERARELAARHFCLQPIKLDSYTWGCLEVLTVDGRVSLSILSKARLAQLTAQPQRTSLLKYLKKAA